MRHLILNVLSFIFLPVLVWLALYSNPAISFLWDMANISGLISVMTLMLLFFYTSKPQANPPYEGRFFIRLHQYLGHFCFFALFAHVAILAVIEPLTLNYMLPSAKLSMLSGTLSALSILFLAFTSQEEARKKIWRNYQNFRNFHYLSAVLALLLVALHIISTEFYISSLWEKWGLVLLIFLSITLLKYWSKYQSKHLKGSLKTGLTNTLKSNQVLPGTGIKNKKPARVKGVSSRALYFTLALTVTSVMAAAILALTIHQKI